MVLDKYIDSKTKIRFKHNKCDNITCSYPYDFIRNNGVCHKCGWKTKFNDIFEFEKELNTTFGNEFIIESGEYKNVNSKIKFIHNTSKPHSFCTTPYNLIKSNGKCSVCTGNQVYKGINDLYTTNPDIAILLNSSEDGYLYSKGSKKKVEFKCCNCGNIEEKSISSVVSQGYSCSVCSDGISYPNKFIFNLLNSVKEDLDFLEREWSPEWCKFTIKDDIKRGIYDIYFGTNGNKYIIEMDGGFHFNDNKLNGQLKEISREIDDKKDYLAYKNNIKVIRINCDYGNMTTKRYSLIKTNILNSELSNIINLNKINFDEIDLLSNKSILLKTCLLWNEGYSNKEICKELKLNRTTVSDYLAIGKNINLCDYTKKKSRSRSSNKTKIMCLNTGEIFESLSKASEWCGLKSGSHISQCCSNERKSAGKDPVTNEKLNWKFI